MQAAQAKRLAMMKAGLVRELQLTQQATISGILLHCSPLLQHLQAIGDCLH